MLYISCKQAGSICHRPMITGMTPVLLHILFFYRCHKFWPRSIFLFISAIPQLPELLTTRYRLHIFHTWYGNKETISASQTPCPKGKPVTGCMCTSRSALRQTAHHGRWTACGNPFFRNNAILSTLAAFLAPLLSLFSFQGTIFMNPEQGHAMLYMVILIQPLV